MAGRLLRCMSLGALLALAGSAAAQGPPSPFDQPPAGGQPPAEASSLAPAPGAGAAIPEQANGSAPAATGGATEAVLGVSDFRFERTQSYDGQPGVRRVKLSAEDVAAYDDEWVNHFKDMAPGGPRAADAAAWAQWQYYSDQLQMWSEYMKMYVLAGNDSSYSFDTIKWPGTPAPAAGAAGAAGGAGGTGAGADPGAGYTGANQVIARNQNKSMDEQLGDFNPFSGIGGGNGQAANYPPNTIEDQVKKLYNNWYKEARKLEKTQQRDMTDFSDKIQSRRSQREAYTNWRDERKQLIEDALVEWNRRYTGDVALIGGVRYELYRPGTVPANIPRGTSVVVTDYALTPYDILTDDGKVKEPARD